MCRSLVSIYKDRKKLGEGGGQSGNCESLRPAFETANSQLSNVNYGFELAIMEMAFALCEFEFKVFTLPIDIQFRIVTFGNRFLNFSSRF